MEAKPGSFRAVCEQIRAMDPTVPPGPALEQLALELEGLDAKYADERVQGAIEAKRQLADLEELHRANRMVTVGTLTTGLAHELGTPLGVVLARAQMIIADDSDLSEVRQDAEVIVAQVLRMTQMCREVLDFARPKPPTRDPVDLVQLLRQMIALLMPEARKRTVTLVLAEVDERSNLRVLGDPWKLMQIFTNLTINAAQAMPGGGTVHFVVERTADYICVHVRDTGTGIPSADLDHIFEPFFTTKKSEGTGIGLAVSARIAREHGGSISVVSEEGRGSTFTVCLPPLP